MSNYYPVSGILEETAENIERLIKSAPTIQSMANGFDKCDMPQSAKILREGFEEIMRVAVSLKAQQTGEVE